MIGSLPKVSGRASTQSSPADAELRPFLLVLPGREHVLDLITAIQDAGVPCVLAFDTKMLDYWLRTEQPTVTMIDLDISWANQAAEELIRQGAKVVGLSNDEDVRMGALGRGFEDAFPTSLAPSEIAMKLRLRFLDRAALPIEVPLEGGPLGIDMARRRLWWWQEEKKLSAKQFDLLSYLAARSDRMIPIETLLRDIWREAWGDRNKVTKMISRIREALGPDAAAYVVSDRGYYGYISGEAEGPPQLLEP